MFHGGKSVTPGNLLPQGAVMYLINAFPEPLWALRGWTRTDIATSLAVGSPASIISVAFPGSLSGGLRLRVLMTAGARSQTAPELAPLHLPLAFCHGVSGRRRFSNQVQSDHHWPRLWTGGCQGDRGIQQPG